MLTLCIMPNFKGTKKETAKCLLTLLLIDSVIVLFAVNL